MQTSNRTYRARWGPALCLAVALAGGDALRAALAAGADDIIGRYWTPGRERTVEVYKHDELYYAKLAREEPGASDEGPRDVVFMEGFAFDGQDGWSDGRITSPRDGKTYRARLWLDEDGNLMLRGFLGVSLFGRTAMFERVR